MNTSRGVQTKKKNLLFTLPNWKDDKLMVDFINQKLIQAAELHLDIFPVVCDPKSMDHKSLSNND